jgi:hypothetical protein
VPSDDHAYGTAVKSNRQQRCRQGTRKLDGHNEVSVLVGASESWALQVAMPLAPSSTGPGGWQTGRSRPAAVLEHSSREVRGVVVRLQLLSASCTEVCLRAATRTRKHATERPFGAVLHVVAAAVAADDMTARAACASAPFDFLTRRALGRSCSGSRLSGSFALACSRTTAAGAIPAACSAPGRRRPHGRP